MTQARIRWGILSTARIGTGRVIPAIQKSRNGKVLAIASRSMASAQAAAQEMGIERAYGSYEDLLADPDIDAIYNPLPNHLHAPWSLAAAKAGIPTLCEKPFAMSASEAEAMVEGFHKRSVLLAEAFMYRFHPQTDRVRELVSEGAIGEVRLLRGSFAFNFDRPGNYRLKPEMGGGGLMDVGCYPITYMRLITGEEPEHASGYARMSSTGIDDLFAGVLSFPSGVIGHFDCGFEAAFHQRFEVHGSEGRIVARKPFTPNPDEEPVIEIWHGDEVTTERIAPVDHYQLMVEDFADALLEGRPLRFEPGDAVATMRVLDALMEAARE